MSIQPVTDPSPILGVPGHRAEPQAGGALSVVAGSYGSRDRVVRWSLAAGDLLAIVLAVFVAATLAPDGANLAALLLLACALMPLWLILFKTYGLYDRDMARINVVTLDDAPTMFHAVLVGTVLMWLLAKLLPIQPLAGLVMAWFGVAVLAIGLLLRACTRRLVVRNLGPERALIVGDPQSTNLRSKLEAHPEYGVVSVRRLVGLSDEVLASVRDLGAEIGCDSDSVIAVARQARAERLIINEPDLEADVLADLVRECKREGLKVTLLPRVSDVLGPSVELDDLEGLSVIGIIPPVLSPSSRLLKRTMDICVSAALLVLTAPLMLLIALLVKLDSSGPALFRQERVGRHGQPFTVVKFRTMTADAEDRLEAVWAGSASSRWLKIDDDPRVTRLGRILRMTSLDELPQFWNVLRGEMSIVGPRPLSIADDQQVGGWARGRLDLSPGITGLWQVLGRTDIPFDEMIRLDYRYITNWSIWNDLRIIFATVPALITQRGAN